MNSTTILRPPGRPRWAFVGTLIAMLAACGNESINVLAPRDAAADLNIVDTEGDASIDTSDPPIDVSVDMPGPTDGPALDGATLDTPAVDGPTSDAPTTGCLAIGAPCAFAGACCFLACPLPSVPGVPRTCAAGPVCGPAGDPCGSNIDCCSDCCVGGFCVGVTPGRCLPAGEPCATDGACCGARCRAMAGGPTKCALLAACRVLGEVCVTQSDCCSGLCDVDDCGTRVCTVAPACGIAGNACRGQAGDRCAVDGDCCTGGCSADEGVLRCSTPACGRECALCAEDRDCCIGRCVGDESGYRRCENPPTF